MKKFTGLLLAAVLCLPAYAAQTKNTMKMVSYFPVPYVAYDTVSANNAMDIGILNQCAMDINKGSTNLGGSACSLYLYGNATGADLNRGLLNVAAGKLDLDSNVTNARIVSKKVQLGTSMTEENGWLDVKIPSGKNDEYDALYISSLKNTGNSFRVTSKENGAKVNSFHMFNEISNDFPGCAGTVTWQELELAANVNNNETYKDIFLVCNGTGETTEPEACQPPRGNTYTENCPSGQTGIITYTWNQSTCDYSKSDTCTISCTPSYGTWTTSSSSVQDTCDGQQSSAYTCSAGKTGTCIDVIYTENTTAGGDSYGSEYDVTYEAVSKGLDTCPPAEDENIKYTCDGVWSGSCVDVYSEPGVAWGSAFDGGSAPGGKPTPTYTPASSLPPGATLCEGTGITPGPLYDAETYCRMKGWSEYGQTSVYCAVTGGQSYIVNWIVCEPMKYKARNVQCASRRVYKQRTVTCCG